MKYSISLLMALLVALAGTAFAQHEPPGGWPNCSGCLYAAHWLDGVDPVWDTCYYDGCGGVCEDIMGVITGSTGLINIVITNQYVLKNHKSLYIRLKGTGASIPPVIDTIYTNLEGEPKQAVYLREPVVAIDGEGNWEMEIRGVIFPQPSGVNILIMLGNAQLTEAWAWECCTVGSIPSITEWGMVVLVGLMILSAVWIIMRRRKKAIAGV